MTVLQWIATPKAMPRAEVGTNNSMLINIKA